MPHTTILYALGSSRRMRSHRRRSRRGSVLMLGALFMVVLVGMLAFAIDLGYVATVKNELQRTADAAALAGAYELLDFEELKDAADPSTRHDAVRDTAQRFAWSNPAGATAIYVPGNNANATDGDLVLGYVADPADPDDMHFDDEEKYNAVRVRVRRDSVANGPLSLFFAPVLGMASKTLSVEATAIFDKDVAGFKVTDNLVNSKLLPYTLHIDDWNDAFVNGQDNFAHDAKYETVSSGGDDIKEVKLFPIAVTPGNFGSIDVGPPNNSTADQRRQILYGPNADDFSYFPESTLKLGNVEEPLILNGNTGISAGVKSQLESIKGQPRILPLYSSVSGNGNNANFTIVAFVGVTIVDLKLTGSMNSKHITVQPAFVIDSTAIHGGSDGETSRFIRIPLSLIK